MAEVAPQSLLAGMDSLVDLVALGSMRVVVCLDYMQVDESLGCKLAEGVLDYKEVAEVLG